MQNQRRRFLVASGVGTIAAFASAETAAGATSAPAPPLPLTPQVTEGPFYFDPGLVRSEIAEGRPGVPLEVRIRVVDAKGAPLAGFRVDLWHCDADGLYSGYDRQGPSRATNLRGRTFLRGTVASDADGVAVFRTIYPGWYAGRTTHIHLKIFNGQRTILTSQLFLPDALSEYLFTQVPAYHRDTLRDTLNRRDGIALEAGPAACGAVREEADRYVLTATTVVDPEARPSVERPPGPPPGLDSGRDGAGRSGLGPSFQAGNQGGAPHASIGIGNGRGGPRDRPPGAPDGPPPGEGPPSEVLRGEARVAALVPGGGG